MALTYGFDLGPTSGRYSSAQFSDVFRAITGDGVSEYRNQLRLVLGATFGVTLSSGYLYIAGRWAKLDAQISLTIPAAYTTADRYDAIAARVDYSERTVTFTVLRDVDPDNPKRDAGEYNLFLFLIHVRRGATVLTASDITDLRELLVPLSELSAGTAEAYTAATSGIDSEITRVQNAAEEAFNSIDADCTALENEIAQKTQEAQALISSNTMMDVGEIRIAAKKPTPESAWLLCDGSSVSVDYAKLYGLLSGRLPRVTISDRRLKAYIYGGEPSGVSGFTIDENGHLIMSYTGSMPNFYISGTHLYYSGNDAEMYSIGADGHLYLTV